MLHRHFIQAAQNVPVSALTSDHQLRTLHRCFEQQPSIYCEVGHSAVSFDLPLVLDDAATSVSLHSLVEEPSADLRVTIAGQALSLSVLANVLQHLFPVQTKLSVRLNAFSGKFGATVCDVWANTSIDASPAELVALSQSLHIDILPKLDASLGHPGLLVMDMDSTVIAIECIDEIAGLAGVKDKVSEVTERAMRGEIAFTESLYERVACLKGVALDELYAIRDRLPFMPGFVATVNILKRANWKLVIASGGFTFFADYIQHLVGLDAAVSNQLEVVDGVLTGKVVGDVIDAKVKAQMLKHFTVAYSIEHKQSVAMGDGANDLHMMQAAGGAVAYHAKPKVAEAAHAAINVCGFEGLLYSLR
jgi:phosphoserine phosphatase